MKSHTCGKGEGGRGQAGGVPEVAGHGQVGDGPNDGRAHDADRELLAVQLLQQVLAHVLGQRVAVGQVHLLQQLLRLQTPEDERSARSGAPGEECPAHPGMRHAVNMYNPPDSTMYVAGFKGPHMQAARHWSVMHPLSIF